MREMQILKPFANRTEYTVLKEWTPCREVELGDIGQGVCVIPAVVLSKLAGEDSNLLVNWVKQWGNQLLILPPFYSIDLKEKLQLGVELDVTRVPECFYDGLPIKESFISNLNSKLKMTDGQTIALDIFYHSGSGHLTLTTLPLLDYRLLDHEEKCREIFQKLLDVEELKEDVPVKQDDIELTRLHKHVLLLAAGGMVSLPLVCRYLKTCFQTSVDEEQIQRVQQQLHSTSYLTRDGLIGQRGNEFIEQYGYRAFVRELARSASQDGEW